MFWLGTSRGVNRWDLCAPQALLDAAGGCLISGKGTLFPFTGPNIPLEGPTARALVASRDKEAVAPVLRVISAIDCSYGPDGRTLLGKPDRLCKLMNIPLTDDLKLALVGFDEKSVINTEPHSTVLRLTTNLGKDLPMSFYLKRVEPRMLSKRPVKKWLRDMIGYKAEINFFHYYAEEYRNFGVTVPRLFGNWNTGVDKMDKWLANGCDQSNEKECENDVMSCSFGSLTADLTAERYSQHLYLDVAKLKAAVTSLAHLHAFHYGDAVFLTKLGGRMMKEGAYWSPEKRAAIELEQLPEKITTFFDRFLNHPKTESMEGLSKEQELVFREVIAKPRVSKMGERLVAAKVKIDSVLRQKEGDFSGRSLIHGDAKTANLFFRESNAQVECAFIDFQWSGVGLGMADVMYTLTSSSLCEIGSQAAVHEKLIDDYRKALIKFLPEGTKAPETPELIRLFKYILLEYARSVFGSQLAARTPESFIKAKTQLARCGHNRNLMCTLGFIRAVDKTLAELEEHGDLDGKIQDWG